MIPTLQVLKSLFTPDEPLRPHAEVEHVHWDRESQTWRVHDEPAVQEAA
jgi:hypothetical protein